MTEPDNESSRIQQFQFQQVPSQYPPSGKTPGSRSGCFLIFSIAAVVLFVLAALLFLIIKNVLPAIGSGNVSVNSQEMSRGNYPSRVSELREYFASPKNDIGEENLAELEKRLIDITERCRNCTAVELRTMVDFKRMVKQIQESPVRGPYLTGITYSFLADGETIPPLLDRIEIVAVRQSADDPDDIVVFTICSNHDMRDKEICYWMRRNGRTWNMYDWMIVSGGVSEADELAVLNSMVSDRLYRTIEKFHDYMDRAFEFIRKGEMDQARDLIETAARLDLTTSPLFPQTRVRLGYGFLNLQDYEAALEQMSQIGDARNTPAKELLGAMCHSGMENYQEAIDAAQRYIDIVGASPDMLEEQHIAYWSLNQFENAWDTRLRKAMYLSNSLKAASELIEVTPLPKFNRLVPFIEHHVNMGGDAADLNVESMADRFRGVNRGPGIELLIEKATGIASDRVMEGLNADLDFERGEIESAIAHRQKQLELTTDPDSRQELQESIHWELSYQRMFERAYDIADDKSASAQRIGEAYIDGYYDLSAGQLESITAKHLVDFPKDLWAQYCHAIAVGDQFRRDEAVELLQEVLDQQPASTEEVDDWLTTNARTSMAIFLFASGKFEEAIKAHPDSAEAIDSFTQVAVRKNDTKALDQLLVLADEVGVSPGKELEIRARNHLVQGNPRAAIDLLANDPVIAALEGDEKVFIEDLHLEILLKQTDIDTYEFPELTDDKYFEKCQDLYYLTSSDPLQKFLESAPQKRKSHDRYRYYRAIQAWKINDVAETVRFLGDPGWYFSARKLPDYDRNKLKYIDLLIRLRAGDYEGAKQICWKGQQTAESIPGFKAGSGITVTGGKDIAFDIDIDRMAAMEWLIFFLEGNTTECQRVQQEHPDLMENSGFNIFQWLAEIEASSEVLNKAKKLVAKRIEYPYFGSGVTFLFDSETEPNPQASLVDRRFSIDEFAMTKFAATNKNSNRFVVLLTNEDFSILTRAGNAQWLGWDIYSDDWLVDIHSKANSFVTFSPQFTKSPKRDSGIEPVLGNLQFRNWLIDQITATNPIAVSFESGYVVRKPDEAIAWLKTWSADIEQSPVDNWNADLRLIPERTESQIDVLARRMKLVRQMDTFDLESDQKLYIKLSVDDDFDADLGWFLVYRYRQTDDTQFMFDCEAVSNCVFNPHQIIGERISVDPDEVTDWKIE